MDRKQEEAIDDVQVDDQMAVVEANYDRLRDFGGIVRGKYESVYLRMVNELQPQHIDSILQIMRKREKYVVKNVQDITSKLRSHIASQLIRIQEKFWQTNNVDAALAALEMCRDKFKAYKGIKNW